MAAFTNGLRKCKFLYIYIYIYKNDPKTMSDVLYRAIKYMNAEDKITCRAFPTTLKGPTRVSFNRLTPNSISIFKDLST